MEGIFKVTESVIEVLNFGLQFESIFEMMESVVAVLNFGTPFDANKGVGVGLVVGEVVDSEAGEGEVISGNGAEEVIEREASGRDVAVTQSVSDYTWCSADIRNLNAPVIDSNWVESDTSDDDIAFLLERKHGGNWEKFNPKDRIHQEYYKSVAQVQNGEKKNDGTKTECSRQTTLDMLIEQNKDLKSMIQNLRKDLTESIVRVEKDTKVGIMIVASKIDKLGKETEDCIKKCRVQEALPVPAKESTTGGTVTATRPNVYPTRRPAQMDNYVRNRSSPLVESNLVGMAKVQRQRKNLRSQAWDTTSSDTSEASSDCGEWRVHRQNNRWGEHGHNGFKKSNFYGGQGHISLEKSNFYGGQGQGHGQGGFQNNRYYRNGEFHQGYQVEASAQHQGSWRPNYHGNNDSWGRSQVRGKGELC